MDDKSASNKINQSDIRRYVPNTYNTSYMTVIHSKASVMQTERVGLDQWKGETCTTIKDNRNKIFKKLNFLFTFNVFRAKSHVFTLKFD